MDSRGRPSPHGRCLLHCQLPLHCFANDFPIYAHARAGKTRHGILHHGAHVFHGGRAHLGDHGFYSSDDLGVAGGFGQVGLDQNDLGGFFVGHLLASAFGELLNGIFTLFDQRGEDGLRFFIVEGRHLFDLAVLECGLHHAQSGQALLLARFHRGGDVFLDLFGEAHNAAIIAEEVRSKVCKFCNEPVTKQACGASDAEEETTMSRLAIWAQLEAKPGKEKEVEDFLKSAQPLAEREPATVSWYAIKLGPGKYGIFDTFADENGRNAHLNGEIAKALFAKAKDLFSKPPDIAKPEVLAAKSARS